VGDNEEVVDERLWDAEDDEAEGGPDSRKEAKYEKDAPMQVRGAGAAGDMPGAVVTVLCCTSLGAGLP
jgi:hypothetical protein